MGAPHGNKNAAGAHKRQGVYYVKKGQSFRQRINDVKHLKLMKSTLPKPKKIRNTGIKKQHAVLDAYTRKMEKLYKQK